MLDLQNAINKGDYPSWDVFIQVIKPEEISKAPFNIFDMTKVWPKSLYPLGKTGRITSIKNPQNWFTEIEQAAFSPSNMVPGIAPSPDPMLQARMFAYPDASRYRLGVNYQFLPTNAAKTPVYRPLERDGLMNFTSNYGADLNYLGTRLMPVNFSTRNASGFTVASTDHKDFAAAQAKMASTKLSEKNLDEVQLLTPISSFTEVDETRDFEQQLCCGGAGDVVEGGGFR